MTVSRSTLVPFVPYAAVGLLHLVALAVGAELLATFTKPILMPLLFVALSWALRRATDRPARGELAVFASIGILFSWAGDVLLGAPLSSGFLLGLGSFFCAHLSYLLLFLRPLRRRRLPWAALLLLPWWVLLLIVLAPHLGALIVPVAIYGLVLGAVAAAALACNRWVAVGALLFLASDTLLALKQFLPDFGFWQADFLIMLLYIAGQGLISYGVVRAARPSAPVVVPSAPTPVDAGS